MVVILGSLQILAAGRDGQQAVFRTGVRLLRLDVTVVDREGQPIGGLTPADFAVRIGGAERPVQALEYLEWTASRSTSPGTAPVSSTARNGRTYVLVVDDLSFRPADGRELRAAAERFLQTMNPDDLVGVTTTSGLGPVVSPSRDRAAAVAAIARAAGQDTHSTEPYFVASHEAVAMARGFDHATIKAVVARECALVQFGMQCESSLQNVARGLAIDLRRRLEVQLASIRHAVTAMSAAPAPRVVVVLTAGLALEAALDLPVALAELGDLASRAGVHLYALAAGPGDSDGSMRDRSELRTAARRREGVVLTEGIQTVAEAAGGTAFRVIGGADRFLDRVVSETSAIYRLGIEVPEDLDPTGPLRAEVSVRRRGATVRTTGRPRDPLDNPAASVSATFREAGTDATIALNARVRAKGASEVEVLVDTRLPKATSLPARLVVTLLRPDGTAAFAAQKDLSAPPAADEHHVAIALPAPPGEYRVRAELTDGAGVQRGREIAIRAALMRTGTLAVSDILLSVPDSTGADRFWAADELPDRASRMTAVIEIYPAAGARGEITVNFSIGAEPETAPIVQRTAAARGADARWTAAADVSLDSLRSGAYVLRADVLQSGTVVATQTRRLIKP
jgi:VWFA-related protein